MFFTLLVRIPIPASSTQKIFPGVQAELSHESTRQKYDHQASLYNECHCLSTWDQEPRTNRAQQCSQTQHQRPTESRFHLYVHRQSKFRIWKIDQDDSVNGQVGGWGVSPTGKSISVSVRACVRAEVVRWICRVAVTPSPCFFKQQFWGFKENS